MPFGEGAIEMRSLVQQRSERQEIKLRRWQKKARVWIDVGVGYQDKTVTSSVSIPRIRPCSLVHSFLLVYTCIYQGFKAKAHNSVVTYPAADCVVAYEQRRR